MTLIACVTPSPSTSRALSLNMSRPGLTARCSVRHNASPSSVLPAAGVLPWPEGEATAAAARCFQDWLSARGGTEPAEVRDGIAQVCAFLLAHGMSRFVPAWDEDAAR